MKKYYITENNSGGYSEAMEFGEYVLINATNYLEAIIKFEKAFDLKYDYENSYEGNSCNCCGRRFTTYTPNKDEDSGYDLMQIEYYKEEPYFLEFKKQKTEL
jgi:hypothetical protein